MYPELMAKLVLALYAATATVLIVRSIRRCEGGTDAWLLYCVQRMYGGLMFHWRANGRCPFPAHGPALIIANHRSPVDPLMLWMNHHLRATETATNIRVIGFLTAREYCEMPGLRWICRAMQSIPTERDGKDSGPAKQALRRLKDGMLVGVFPEGRINRETRLQKANTGVAWLALRSQVPVYPVFLHDVPQGTNMVEPFCTLSRVRVSYGEPINLAPYYHLRKNQDTLQEVTDLMMNRLAKLGGVGRRDAVEESQLPFQRRTG